MLVDDAGLSRLATSRFGRLVQLSVTASTNAVASARAAAGEPEGLVVVADYQSAGRGRFDRRWESPPGTSLLFSVLMRPTVDELPSPRRHLAVAALSLAIVDAAAAVAHLDLQLKWPNDVVHGDAKVAGILAETTPPAGSGPGAVVVGAGVNVAWAPAELGATSLQALARRQLDRAALLVATLGALDALYGRWGHVAERYRAECATVGRYVAVKRGGDMTDLEGLAVGVSDEGHLLVQVPEGGTETVAAGDVLHTRPS